MNNFDVYAIGNALVDTEYRVTDDVLERLNVSKGLMTLIDEKRLNELENGVGVEVSKQACGGSAANSVIALAQLGGKSFYCCKVANDKGGDFYLKDLKENGVSIKNGYSGSEGQDATGRCLVLISPDAERSMNTYLGSTSSFSIDELSKDDLKNSKYLFIEGYLVTAPDAFKAVLESIKDAKELGVKIALTLSDPGVVSFFKKQFHEILETKIDLLFANEQEALEIAETKDLNEALGFLKTKAHKFVVTLGAKGLLGFDGEKEYKVSGKEVNAINANGAGDMFAGAFLYSMTQNYDFQKACEFSNLMAANIVTKHGPRLTIKEVQEIQASFK